MKRSPLKRRSSKPTKALRKKAWSVFALWVKNRDKWTCITCGKRYPKGSPQMNAGHFKHKDCLDFDERNINAQCARCNKWGHGRLDIYGDRLREKWGASVTLHLEQQSKQPYKFSKAEL